MKAIIMAGGEGSRLRPLTCDCPKPMVPLMDRPVMSYALALLARHGIRDAAITLHYLPDRVRDHFGDGSSIGFSLRYYVEQEPLGTAGSVYQAQDFLDETFVVLSGDGITDCDLTQALRFHRKSGSSATLVLKRVENPLEYGLVVADADGRIQRFVEKPGKDEVFSDTVNTGIYILEPSVLSLIPANRSFDFARDLFPHMLREGMPLYGFVTDGYWCDIGDISAYLRAHEDALRGKINLPIPCRPGGVFCAEGARIEREAVLEGPCFIGEGALIKSGARVGPGSVVGRGSIVEEHACIKRSVLWPNARMKAQSQARGCVLAEKACMEAGSSAFEESVLGSGALLGQHSSLMPGVKVWPHKQIAPSLRLDCNLVWGGGRQDAFCEGRLILKSPSHAARAAQAYASAVRPQSVLVARAASSVALSCSLAVQSGLMAQGVQVLDAGTASVPQLRVMNERLHKDGCLFIDGESMRPLDAQGAELSLPQRRSIEALLHRQDFERPFTSITKLPVPAGRCDLMYIGYLLEHADTQALRRTAPALAVCAPTEQLLSAAECVFEKIGCPVRAEWEEELMELSGHEIGLWLIGGGEDMRLCDADVSLTHADGLLLRVWALLEQGEKRIVLPMSAPRSAEALARGYRAQVVRVKSERAHLMHALLEESRHQLMMHFDGLYAALVCIGLLCARELSLSAWKRRMPSVCRQTRSVEVQWQDKGHILASLLAQEPSADLTDGISVCRNGAWVWISPSADSARCRIVTDAQSTEAAQELCDFYEEKIHRIAKERSGKSPQHTTNADSKA